MSNAKEIPFLHKSLLNYNNFLQINDSDDNEI